MAGRPWRCRLGWVAVPQGGHGYRELFVSYCAIILLYGTTMRPQTARVKGFVTLREAVARYAHRDSRTGVRLRYDKQSR